MTGERILVLGATGTVGRRVAEQLRGHGYDVAAASRRGAVRFDWAEPESWRPAVEGASGVFVMAPDGVEVDPRFISLAVSAGARRLVLLSSKAIEIMGDQRLLRAEQAVKDSGAEWSIVRADWFNQNFDEGFLRDAVLAGEVTVPLGEMRQAFNDADDIAAVVVAALTESGHGGRTYELSGPAALSFAEATEVVSRASGRPVRYLGGTDHYVRVMTGLGLDRAQVLRDVEAFEALRSTGDAVVDDTVERVTGRRPKSFETYAAEAAARGTWT